MKNSFGTHNRIEFVHKIKQQILDRSGYNKLDTHLQLLGEITTPAEEEIQPEEDDNDFVYTVISGIKQNNHNYSSFMCHSCDPFHLCGPHVHF